MARNNGDFNRWMVREVAKSIEAPQRILELGPGPGVGLRELLLAIPSATVIGVDPPPEMLDQAGDRTADVATAS